jgi:hypothetical protein
MPGRRPGRSNCTESAQMTRVLRPSSNSELRSREGSAAGWRAGTIAAIALALLAGCAPDAFRRKPEFEDWVRGVRTECYQARIGTTTVGNLLVGSGSREGAHFFNQLSRLYAGILTPEQWTSGVTPFLGGRASDPGVKCVLDQLPTE